METWIKPNGTEIQVNENSAEVAESLGWVRKSAKVEPQETPKRRGRPPKSSYAAGDDE